MGREKGYWDVGNIWDSPEGMEVYDYVTEAIKKYKKKKKKKK